MIEKRNNYLGIRIISKNNEELLNFRGWLLRYPGSGATNLVFSVGTSPANDILSFF